jgi:hypothetical protein
MKALILLAALLAALILPPAASAATYGFDEVFVPLICTYQRVTVGHGLRRHSIVIRTCRTYLPPYTWIGTPR